MKALLSKLLGGLTMYQAILYFLRGLIATATLFSLFGWLDFVWWHILADMLLFLVFCWASNWFFCYLAGIKPNFESQYITAQILALIMGPIDPVTGWWVIFLASFLAMATKYVLVHNKKHLLNPAAVGALGSALILGQGASWWVGNRFLLPFVLIGGILVVQKLKWFHLVFSFLAAYLITLTLTLLANGLTIDVIASALQASILDSAVLFFATVMLVEPLTAPRGKGHRIVYGLIIGTIMVLIPYFFPSYGYSIETSLILGNILAFFLSPKTFRQRFKFIEKKQEAKDTYSLWFEPFKKFEFKPGQFMEWSLPHSPNDSRGFRRFFTISSSPTENRIRLITRLYPKPSTFKQSLLNLKPGDEIYASHLEGDFTLPNDENEKLVMVAGGVGIAPYLSMIRYLLDQGKRRDIILVYANKTQDDMAFHELLKKANQQLGLKTINLLNDPPQGWDGPTGFLTQELVRQHIPDWQTRKFYISGPEPMVINYESMFRRMGIAKNKIIRDYFPGYSA